MPELTAVPRTADPQTLTKSLGHLELVIRGRLDGLLQGNHLGLVPGPGSEPGDTRLYEPGDDVRHIDWAVTARTTETHFRQTIADRELETWLAIDLSASMDFGTVHCEKRDLAVVAAAIIAHLTRGGANRIGAVIAAGDTVTHLPARSGLVAARQLIRQIALTPRSPAGVRADLAGALERLRRPPRRAGLVVAISDFLGADAWEGPLRALAARHDALAVDISDPRDRELPSVGLVTLVDPETGRSRQVRTTARLRDDFARAATDHRQHLAVTLRRMGVSQLSLATDRDWVTDVLRFVMRRKAGWDGQSVAATARRGAV